MRSTLLFILLLSGCTIPLAAPQRSPLSPLPATAFAEVERAVLTEINRVRRANGVGALRPDAALDRAAQEHSHELATRGALDHNSTDAARRTPGLRVTAAGVAWIGVAENLAAMSGAAESVAARTAELWLRSPGHRTNMLDARYTHTGIGVVVDRRGVWYVTQVYVLPQGR